MDSIYILYDLDLEAAYEIDLYSEVHALLENEHFAEQEASVRWIPIEQFRALRRHFIVAVIAKEGEYCTSKLTFRSRAQAEEVAHKLGGEVREISIF